MENTWILAALAGAVLVFFAIKKRTPAHLPVPAGPMEGDKVFKPYALIKKTEVSPDTKIFTFGLEPDQSLGLPIG
jgi:cytochrome-b5 reductase